MTVYELCELYSNSFDEIDIWNCYRERIVERGTSEEIQIGEWADCEVLSLEVNNGRLIIDI